MARFSPSESIVHLRQRLRGGQPVPAEVLAQELGVNQRTVKRQIATLQRQGHDVQPYYDEDDNGRLCYVLADDGEWEFTLSTRERASMLVASDYMGLLFRGTPFDEDFRSAQRKLDSSDDPAHKDSRLRLRSKLIFVPDGGIKDYSKKLGIIDAVQDAVFRERVLKYRYMPGKAGAEEEQGYLAPYAIMFWRQGLYVVGRALGKTADSAMKPSKQVPRCWPVERFIKASCETKHRFAPPPADVMNCVEDAIGPFFGRSGRREKVVIDFSPERALYAKARRWHRSEEWSQAPDGWARLTMQVPDSTPLLSFALEWGKHARVSEPASLRNQVADELRGAALQYASE